jgi:eukaryotic-like serine/threonine-protein kinase
VTKSNGHLINTGTRIGKNVTVLGVVDGGAKDPVYIGWHHGAWCPMACKVFRSHHRAEREANIISAFTHPYIIRLLGLEKPGLLLMEFLEGPTLSHLLDGARAHRLGISDAIRVTIHLGAALQHVHLRGFMHLDVKPANVIIARSGHPMLFDFGSARQIGARRTAHVVGTDLYIAPEECRRGTVTPQADVFSLGVSLYEMLTGEFPFGDGTRSDPFPQMRADLVPARRRRRVLPADLDAIVLSCLSRDPDKRPPLEVLMPSLHDFIKVGPKMWPDGFRPESMGEDKRGEGSRKAA